MSLAAKKGTNYHPNYLAADSLMNPANPKPFPTEPFEKVSVVDDDGDESSDSTDVDVESFTSTYQQANPTQHFDDDPCVYANLSEISRRKMIEEIDRRSDPPIPKYDDKPIRVISSGWEEHKTLGGRSYYFHPENGIRQWKPPRTTVSGLRKIFDSTNSSECEASTSSLLSAMAPITHQSSFLTSTEFAEMPLITTRNEYDIPESAYNNGFPLLPLSTISECDNLLSIHRSALSDCERGDFEPTGRTGGIMSHSVDGNIRNYGSGAPRIGFERSNTELPTSATMFHQLSQFSLNGHCMPPNSDNLHEGKAIRHGSLEKFKVMDNGIRAKKRDWSTVYAYLYTGHLLFYKDQKSAEKTGKHYPAPSEVCDLRSACVSIAENEHDKRRKKVISLVLYSKTEYLIFCGGNEIDMMEWHSALRSACTLSPPSKVIVGGPYTTIISDYAGSLHRSSSRAKNTISKSAVLNSSVKSKQKRGSKSSSPERGGATGGEENVHPTRESIIERLLRFFRSRPSMESLKERGIYKPEPVFGSTLSEITAHEKSTVPKFIVEVTRLIETKGLEADGLYRVNGNLSAVQKIRCQVDQDKYDALRTEEDVHVLTGALKLFLRELSEPIFPQCMHREFMSAIRETGIRRFRAIDELLLKLPTVNKEALRVLILHLERVATHAGKNRMQIHNLAIIFGPSLFCTEERIHTRKGSNSTGKNAKGAKKKSGSDKKGQNEQHQQQSGSGLISSSTEPNQNLAYKMVVYGQIVEFILNEAARMTVFKETTPG